LQAKGTGLLPDRGARAGLTRGQQVVVLLIAVSAFLFLQGPAWWEPYDYPRLWRQISWSYLPIPVLVAAMLWARRRFTLLTFVVDTALLVLVKFVVTATIMVAAWSLTRPPREPLPSLVRPVAERRGLPGRWTPPAATPLDPATLARLEGTVTDASGQPVAGALVRVVDDFPGIVFAPRTDALVLEDDGTGPHPAVSAVQVGQPLVLRSTDGRLHVLRAERPDGRIAFNQPMLAAGSTHVVPRAWGELRLSCGAHGDGETTATLHVLAHPFFATTGPDGAFSFDRVPAGRHVVAVQVGDAVNLLPVELVPGTTAKLLAAR
jgi:hypothetical protein